MPTILEIRQSHGLTLHQFANRLSVASGLVTDWETGRHRPSRRHRVRIAAMFGVPLDAVGVETAQLTGDDDAE
jgi:transcriptional regulator with XRE-family HTH domain